MKIRYLLVGLFFVYSSFLFAQNNLEENKSKQTYFGVYAGYVNLTAKVKVDIGSASQTSTESEGGLTLGLIMTSKINKDLFFQPAIQYGNIEDESWLFVPIMFKYYIIDKFNLMAGPQATFFLEDKQGFPFNTTGLDVTFGAGFDLTDQLFLEARYAFELTNRTDDPFTEFLANEFDPIIQTVDVNTKVNSFHMVLGYRF